jgi:hypothetical protein
MKAAAWAPLLSLLSGCATLERSEHANILLTGHWGKPGIGVTMHGEGGSVHWACASAQFQGAARTDIGGHFLKAGTYRVLGRSVAGGTAASEPANISGRLNADGSLWVDVSIRSGQLVRSQRLNRVKSPVVTSCP